MIFLVVVFKTAKEIYISWQMTRTTKEFDHFLDDFSGPLRKLSIFFGSFIGQPR